MRRLLKIVVALVVLIAIAASAGVAYLFANYPDVPAADNITVVAVNDARKDEDRRPYST